MNGGASSRKAWKVGWRLWNNRKGQCKWLSLVQENLKVLGHNFMIMQVLAF